MEWTQLVAQVGFPIVVAGYFMFRMEKVLVKCVVIMSGVATLLQLIAEKNNLKLGVDLDKLAPPNQKDEF